jgi:putative flippase GtrA
LKRYRRVCSFALVGTIAFIVDASVLCVVLPLTGEYLARIPSFLGGASVAWLLNRRLTFHDRPSGHSRARELVLYTALMVLGALINVGVYALLVANQPLAASFPVLAAAAGTLCAMLVNLSTSSLLLYRLKQEPL